MDYYEYEKVLENINGLSEEDRLMIVYSIIDNLEKDLLESISNEKATRISPCVIARTISLLAAFERTLTHAYVLEETRVQREDIDNSGSFILR